MGINLRPRQSAHQNCTSQLYITFDNRRNQDQARPTSEPRPPHQAPAFLIYDAAFMGATRQGGLKKGLIPSHAQPTSIVSKIQQMPKPRPLAIL